MKKLNLKQLEARKAEADRIAREARKEADRADYDLQRATIEDLKGAVEMPIPTRRELIERNRELEERVQELESRLGEISDLATSGEEEEDDEDDGRD